MLKPPPSADRVLREATKKGEGIIDAARLKSIKRNPMANGDRISSVNTHSKSVIS